MYFVVCVHGWLMSLEQKNRSITGFQSLLAWKNFPLTVLQNQVNYIEMENVHYYFLTYMYGVPWKVMLHLPWLTRQQIPLTKALISSVMKELIMRSHYIVDTYYILNTSVISLPWLHCTCIFNSGYNKCSQTTIYWLQN